MFKPRKLKKAAESYRDRADERRSGKDGDYAQVEAILEEFEKKNADNEDRAAVRAHTPSPSPIIGTYVGSV